MTTLVTGTAAIEFCNALTVNSCEIRHVENPQTGDFDGVSSLYHVTNLFDPDSVAKANNVFALARAACVSTLGWQARLGPYDVTTQAGRNLADIHGAVWHAGLPFFIAQPAYALEWVTAWGSRSPVDPAVALPWIGQADLAAAVAVLLQRSDHEGGIYELCRRRGSVREMAGQADIVHDISGELDRLPAEQRALAEPVFARLSDGISNGNPAMFDWLLSPASVETP